MSDMTILFDLDDTLVIEYESVDETFVATCALAEQRHGIGCDDLHKAVREYAGQIWYASPYAEFCRTIGISSWEGLWGNFTDLNADLKAIRDWSPAYRHQVWENALSRCGVEDAELADELAKLFPVERRKRFELLPHAQNVLQNLHGNCKLGIVTNGAPGIQREKLNATNITGFFDCIVVSGEEGIGKPDPGIFRIALEKLNTSPEETVMIGNNLEKDIHAAQLAGIKGVWLKCRSHYHFDGITANVEIESLEELIPTLRELGFALPV